MLPSVSIIIATAGIKSRANSLLKSIESCKKQEKVNTKILIILNGKNIDDDLKKILMKDQSLIIKYRDEGNATKARNYGISLIDTDFFCFLDDDDLYIENTLYLRCNALINNPSVDVVTTNGIIHIGERNGLIFPKEMDITNPIDALLEQNWLASCSGLYRTKSISENLFEKNAKYYEWTKTAFLIGLEKKILFLEEPTFIINDTKDSLSESLEYLEAYPDFLKTLLEYPIPDKTKKIIREKITHGLHNISEYHLKNKNIAKAILYHAKCLIGPKGLQYLFFTRKFFTKG